MNFFRKQREKFKIGKFSQGLRQIFVNRGKSETGGKCIIALGGDGRPWLSHLHKAVNFFTFSDCLCETCFQYWPLIIRTMQADADLIVVESYFACGHIQ